MPPNESRWLRALPLLSIGLLASYTAAQFTTLPIEAHALAWQVVVLIWAGSAVLTAVAWLVLRRLRSVQHWWQRLKRRFRTRREQVEALRPVRRAFLLILPFAIIGTWYVSQATPLVKIAVANVAGSLNVMFLVLLLRTTSTHSVHGSRGLL